MTDPHRQEPSADGKDTERVPAAEAPTGTESDESPVATPSPAGAEHPEAPTAEPADSTPAEPSPTEPSPTDSAPVDSSPAESSPAESSPTDSTVTEQAPGHEAGEEAPGASVPPPGEAPAAKTRKPGRAALVTGIVIGVVGVVVAVLAVTAYAWPGFLAGPGDPADVGSRAVAALSAKDSAALDALTCRGPDGQAVTQIPPGLLQVIQATKQTGGPQLLWDTQAQVPVTVTLAAQGQTQDVPAAVILGVTGGDWCLAGLSQAQ